MTSSETKLATSSPVDHSLDVSDLAQSLKGFAFAASLSYGYSDYRALLEKCKLNTLVIVRVLSDVKGQHLNRPHFYTKSLQVIISDFDLSDMTSTQLTSIICSIFGN